jgi:drug/metabolite transporter (DMT)-like permease
VAIWVALGGALSIGSADFLGGLCARRSGSLATSFWVNLVALVGLALIWPLVQPELSMDRALGALAAGIMSAAGVTLIYAALATSLMSVVAPAIACGSALVPTAVAAAVGNAPSVTQSIGIVLALVGVVSITRTPRTSASHFRLERRGLVLTLLASVCGGVSFSILLLATRGGTAETALGVSALERLSATLAALALAAGLLRGRRLVVPPKAAALGAGGLDGAGVTLLLVSATLGNVAVSAVIVSLYAIITVLLAQIVLRERIATHQMLGIGGAVLGVALLSAG